MSLQNRVDPWGQLHAVPERGTMMGNRGGKFHRDDRTLGSRRWASHHWICCELEWKGAHHEPMGQGYTSLFFLDEVTALAAGHRPCFFCRRKEAKAFLAGRSAGDFDRQLHAERIPPREAGRVDAEGIRVGPERLYTLTLRCPAQPGLEGAATGHDASRLATFAPQHEELGDLPDGAMVEIDGAAFAVRGQHLLRWSFAGYVESIPRKPRPHGRLLTCPSIAAILARGYKPRWHPSAFTYTGEAT